MHSCKELNSFLSEVRRMETLEQRVNGHDQANRTLLEQIMKLTQDMKVRISVIYLLWILPQGFGWDTYVEDIGSIYKSNISHDMICK